MRVKSYSLVALVVLISCKPVKTTSVNMSKVPLPSVNILANLPKAQLALDPNTMDACLQSLNPNTMMLYPPNTPPLDGSALKVGSLTVTAIDKQRAVHIDITEDTSNIPESYQDLKSILPIFKVCDEKNVCFGGDESKAESSLPLWNDDIPIPSTLSTTLFIAVRLCAQNNINVPGKSTCGAWKQAAGPYQIPDIQATSYKNTPYQTADGALQELWNNSVQLYTAVDTVVASSNKALTYLDQQIANSLNSGTADAQSLAKKLSLLKTLALNVSQGQSYLKGVMNSAIPELVQLMQTQADPVSTDTATDMTDTNTTDPCTRLAMNQAQNQSPSLALAQADTKGKADAMHDPNYQNNIGAIALAAVGSVATFFGLYKGIRLTAAINAAFAKVTNLQSDLQATIQKRLNTTNFAQYQSALTTKTEPIGGMSRNPIKLRAQLVEFYNKLKVDQRYQQIEKIIDRQRDLAANLTPEPKLEPEPKSPLNKIEHANFKASIGAMSAGLVLIAGSVLLSSLTLAENTTSPLQLFVQDLQNLLLIRQKLQDKSFAAITNMENVLNQTH